MPLPINPPPTTPTFLITTDQSSSMREYLALLDALGIVPERARRGHGLRPTRTAPVRVRLRPLPPARSLAVSLARPCTPPCDVRVPALTPRRCRRRLQTTR